MNALRWIGYFFAVLLFGCGAPFSSTSAIVDAGDVRDAVLEHDQADAGDELEHDGGGEAAAVDVAGDERDPLDAAGDVAACNPMPPAPPYPTCGCQTAPACTVPPCTWQIGPVYCANGAPQCTLVPRLDGGC